MSMVLMLLAVVGLVIFVLAMVGDRDKRSERERLRQKALANKDEEIEILRGGKL